LRRAIRLCKDRELGLGKPKIIMNISGRDKEKTWCVCIRIGYGNG